MWFQVHIGATCTYCNYAHAVHMHLMCVVHACMHNDTSLRPGMAYVLGCDQYTVHVGVVSRLALGPLALQWNLVNPDLLGPEFLSAI